MSAQILFLKTNPGKGADELDLINVISSYFYSCSVLLFVLYSSFFLIRQYKRDHCKPQSSQPFHFASSFFLLHQSDARRSLHIVTYFMFLTFLGLHQHFCSKFNNIFQCMFLINFPLKNNSCFSAFRGVYIENIFVTWSLTSCYSETFQYCNEFESIFIKTNALRFITA